MTIPAERIWGALKNYVANTAVSWPGRLRQIHSFFRTRSPGQMLDTAAPWTSPWLPPGYEQNFWNAALEGCPAATSACDPEPVPSASAAPRRRGAPAAVGRCTPVRPEVQAVTGR